MTSSEASDTGSDMAAGYGAAPPAASARLQRIADRLQASAWPGADGWPPPLFLFTDPGRTPDPVRAVAALPPGCGVVYRHFGAPERTSVAAGLRAACDAGGHVLLIAADPQLARDAGADGVHWPRWARASMRRGAMQHFLLNTASAHSALEAAQAARAGADIVFLSPVFVSESPSAGRPLGALRAGAAARGIDAPVYALGGITAANAARLIGTGLAGLAAVSALSRE